MDSQNSLQVLDNLPSENPPSKVASWLVSTFPTPTPIQRAERKHKCSECRLRFTTITSLNYHTQTVHTQSETRFKCDECDKTFTYERVLQFHKKTIHSNLELCPICNKSFHKSLNHKHIEQNVQYHPCDKCKIYFTNRTDLADHLLTHNSSLYKPKEPTVRTIITPLKQSLNSVLDEKEQNKLDRTSRSVGTVSNTKIQHTNECYRSRSGRILKTKMCCENCSFAPNQSKRSSSEANNRNISLVSVDGDPASEDSGIGSPSCNIFLTPETVQSKKRKTCQEMSPTKPSVAATEIIPDIEESVIIIDDESIGESNVQLNIESSTVNPLDEPENATINPPLHFVNDIDSEIIKSSTSETPIKPQQQSPISELPNITQNDSLNIPINPSCDSGVFTMDMDSEASMSESPAVLSPLSKQFRRTGLDKYYCMRCKEKNIIDTKGHTCWKSRRKRQELFKSYSKSPRLEIFEKYVDVQQTFDNNQNLTSVINESPVPKLKPPTKKRRSPNKIERSKLMECIENEWSASLEISKDSEMLKPITLSTQSFQEEIKEKSSEEIKECPVANERKELLNLQSPEKNDEVEENPLFLDYSLKKEKKDIDSEPYYSADPELIDCDICGLCVADLSWHKKQEHNFVIKKEPMDVEEMETIIEDPSAIMQLAPSWVKAEPDSEDEYVEVFMVLETDEQLMNNVDPGSIIPYCFTLHHFINKLNNHNKTCRRLFITCVVCNLVSYTEELFLKHQLTGHVMSEWWCDFCEKKFQTKSQLIDHLVNFDGEEWLCYECLSCCVDKAHLIDHLKSHNVNLQSFECKKIRHEIFCGDNKLCSFCKFCECGSVSVAILQFLSEIASHVFKCISCFQALKILQGILCDPASSICLIEL